MIFFGFRTRAKALARLLLVCGLCGNPAAQTIIQRTRWFTLFFVPVIPFSTKRVMQCAFCGRTSQLSKDEAARLVAQASTTGTNTTAGPVETTAPAIEDAGNS